MILDDSIKMYSDSRNKMTNLLMIRSEVQLDQEAEIKAISQGIIDLLNQTGKLPKIIVQHSAVFVYQGIWINNESVEMQIGTLSGDHYDKWCIFRTKKYQNLLLNYNRYKSIKIPLNNPNLIEKIVESLLTLFDEIKNT